MTQDELLVKPTGVLIKTTLVDFPGCVASTYFLKGCNLRCPYCYNIQLVEPKSSENSNLIPPVQVLEHLFKRKNVIEGFVISGGEPLLNPLTPFLITKAKELGYKIKIDTNGTLPLILENLLSDEKTKPDFIALDIKTSFEKYKTQIPVTSNFKNANIKDLICKSIELLKSIGNQNYEIRTVLVPNLVTKEDIQKIASIIPQDASWQFAQFRNENCLNPNYNFLTPYTDSQIKELINYAKTLIPNAALR